jgi:hypothetical protein
MSVLMLMPAMFAGGIAAATTSTGRKRGIKRKVNIVYRDRTRTGGRVYLTRSRNDSKTKKRFFTYFSPLVIVCFLLSCNFHFHTTEALMAQRWSFKQEVEGRNCAVSFRHPQNGILGVIAQSSVTAKLYSTSAPISFSLESVLENHNYAKRKLTFSKADLPLWAEVQDQGTAKVCQIVNMHFHNEDVAPKFELEITTNDDSDDGKDTDDNAKRRTVDIGQLTTIWADSSSSKTSTKPSAKLLNANQINEVMEQLYKLRVGKGRDYTKGGLTKKQINKLAATSSDEPSEREHIAQILRQVVKTGPDFVRLIDSDTILRKMQDNEKQSIQQNQQRSLVAQCLADPHLNGGRFKRWQCLWVANGKNGYGDEEVSVVNGGWLVVDQNVRATTEGLQFATQQQPLDSTEKEKVPIKLRATSGKFKNAVELGSDDRIAHRLECLAMGEEPVSSSKNGSKSLLEQDVRTTLGAMNLPATPQGAREALVRIGRWTDNCDGGKASPWSRDMLDAAEWYSEMSKRRKQDLLEAIRKGVNLQGRTDLTKLPCVCIDAAKTAFRDDAIGVRPRVSTGRKVNPQASKWEILLHVADVSDIYTDHPDFLTTDKDGNLKMLRKAASDRGKSRYDLPNGPLHMMPLPVLDALSLEVFKPDWTSTLPVLEQQKQVLPTVNRCITMWVYVDERSGKVLDAGVERTLISRPVGLSFQTATTLLNGKWPSTPSSDGKIDPMASQIKAMLGVANRNIQKWNEYRISTSKRAQAREKRISAYETMSHNVHGSSNIRRDDGKDGFRRTLGHLLVDASMDLYGYGLAMLVRKAGGSLPSIIGARDARIGTGPLRRYIDGMAQRQVLSILCDYGGPPLSRQECFDISKQATDKLNQMSVVTAVKAKAKSSVTSTMIISKDKQFQAVRLLSLQMKSLGKNALSMPAVSTGKGSEVLLTDVGAVAICRGIQGTLKPGTRVNVKIESVDSENGSVAAILLSK